MLRIQYDISGGVRKVPSTIYSTLSMYKKQPSHLLMNSIENNCMATSSPAHWTNAKQTAAHIYIRSLKYTSAPQVLQSFTSIQNAVNIVLVTPSHQSQ